MIARLANSNIPLIIDPEGSVKLVGAMIRTLIIYSKKFFLSEFRYLVVVLFLPQCLYISRCIFYTTEKFFEILKERIHEQMKKELVKHG